MVDLDQRCRKCLIDIDVLIVSILVGNELPAFKVNMGDQVFHPGRFNGGLESEHQHTGKAHLLSKLVGCKRLTKAHLSVPQELRSAVRLIPFCLSEIGHGSLNSHSLLRTHFKGLCAVFNICKAISYSNNSWP